MSTLIATANPSHKQPAEQTGKPSVAHIWLKDWSREHKTYNLLADNNWQSWHDDIILTSGVCRLDDYAYGILECPEMSSDLVAVDNWKYNNMYIQRLSKIALAPDKNTIQPIATLHMKCGQIFRLYISHVVIKQKIN